MGANGSPAPRKHDTEEISAAPAGSGNPAGRGAAKVKAQHARAALAAPSGNAAATGPLLALVLWYTVLVALSEYCFWWTPAPLPASVPKHMFSEARARQHAAYLVDSCPERQVGMPGLEAAHHYIINHGRRLAEAAATHGRVAVEVDVEHHDGAFPISFLGHSLHNAYLNVTNVLLLVTPAGDAAAAARPAVMVVAHHDAPISSPGASDDAGNVAAMLELASNLVASDAPLQAPVLFLFSGAEEPLCQSASAFMHHSKWAPRVGGFVNLEALGPGGVPIVFQHTGAWVVKAYARGAAHPRGAIIAQDIFDAGLVIGETDFSRLSYRHAGQLPGIDIAFLADGAAYHTGQDTVERLRPGVLQEIGETLRGVVGALGEDLAAQYPDGAADHTILQQRQQQQQRRQKQQQRKWQKTPDADKAMFFSLAARKMVAYSLTTARALHPVPLVLALSAPWALAAAAPAAALPPRAGLAAAMGGAVRVTIGLIGAPLMPAAVSLLRGALSGKPMVYFAQPWVAVAIILPAAAATQLLPFTTRPYSAGSTSGSPIGGMPIVTAAAGLAYDILGSAIVNGALAAVTTAFDVGMGVVFASWAAAALLAVPPALWWQGGAATSHAPGKAAAAASGSGSSSGAGGGGASNWGLLVGVLVVATGPAYLCCELGLSVCLALLGRMSLTGHAFTGLGDVISGVLIGVGTLATLGGVVTPMAAALLGRRARRACAVLLLLSVSAAAYASVMLQPYSHEMPKRLLVTHLHRVTPTGDATSDASSDAAAPPARVSGSFLSFAGADSTPIDVLLQSMGLPVAAARATTRVGDEWDSIFPISTLLDARLLPAEPLTAETPLPHVRLLSATDAAPTGEGGGGSSSSGGSAPGGVVFRDVEFEVHYGGRPCWGVLNLTAEAPGGGGSARIVAWSLTDEKWPAPGGASNSGGASESRIVRWTSQRRGGAPWRVSVRLAASEAAAHTSSGGDGGSNGGSSRVQPQLRVTLHVDHLQSTPVLQSVADKLPDWGTLTYSATAYISEWVL